MYVLYIIVYKCNKIKEIIEIIYKVLINELIMIIKLILHNHNKILNNK